MSDVAERSFLHNTASAPIGWRGTFADSSHLVAVDLHKRYGAHQAVAGISLEVHSGEIVGILGPNGAGKTTCFYMMTGLIAPDSGRVLLNDQDITAQPLYKRARSGVGYLAQESSVFRGLSTEQNIMMVLEETQPDIVQRLEMLNYLLNEFALQDVRKVPAAVLSGGERRRLELARALATSPRFMLLDEPFAGVDPVAVADIRRLILDLKYRGIGVIITDHNARETLSVVERVYVIYAGRILMQGTPEEAKAHPDVQRLYLGSSLAA